MDTVNTKMASIIDSQVAADDAIAMARASTRPSNNVTIYESDHDSLPSYTLVSGLPSYDDALEQMKSKLNSKSTSSSANTQKRPSLTKLFNFDTEKSSLDITNYQAPEDVATSSPSYEVSVILPQKPLNIQHEKTISMKPHYGMEPITDLPSHMLNNGESFIINMPAVAANIRQNMEEKNNTISSLVVASHQKPIYSQYHCNEILTPEISKDRKLQIISSNMKIKANSLGNLCEIHR
uniref:CSON007680 protein n=1 Tax=Culicoides sonorensis TaxID=179676 RepID=A0A336LP91_CULSO